MALYILSLQFGGGQEHGVVKSLLHTGCVSTAFVSVFVLVT